MDEMTQQPETIDRDDVSTALAVRPLDYTSVANLEAALDEWGQKRNVIARFIAQNLTKDVDFGSIHIGKDCKQYREKKVCDYRPHWSKNVLFKPGSEKVAALLQLRPTFQRDDETWEMLGRPAGVLCLRCLLLTPDGEIAGEGRGVRDVQKNDYGDSNKAIKMCEKVAQVDAVLRTVALSDMFTQDLDSGADVHDEKPKPASHRDDSQWLRQQGQRGQGQRSEAPREKAWDPEMKRQPLLNEIDELRERAKDYLKKPSMYKALYAHCFHIPSPGHIEAQPVEVLEAGLEDFVYLTGRLELWDTKMPAETWIAEQVAKKAGGVTATVAEGVHEEAGEVLGGLPGDLLSTQQLEERREQENDELLERTNNA